MKSKWKEYPNLFANDKFKAREKNGKNWDIKGFGVNEREVGKFFFHGRFAEPINECTLLARPISDMTDEEWGRMKLAKFNKNQTERRKKWFKIQVLTANDLFYLLSIGVYPFDQNDFNNDDLSELST